MSCEISRLVITNIVVICISAKIPIITLNADLLILSIIIIYAYTITKLAIIFYIEFYYFTIILLKTFACKKLGIV